MSEQEKDLDVVTEDMNDEAIVSFTQRKRKELVDEMTKGGLPTEKGDRIVLLSALVDMDRTAIAKMKIGSQEREGAADRSAALVAAKILSGMGPQMGRVIDSTCTRETPALDDKDLPELELVPGETDIGLSTLTYEQLMYDQKTPEV